MMGRDLRPPPSEEGAIRSSHVGLGAAMGAALLIGWMVVSKEEPQKKAPVDRAALVETMQAQGKSLPALFSAHGTVSAANDVVLQAEVSGRVTWVADDFVAGGRFRQGEILLTLDKRDYLAQAAQAKANWERAKLELELERSRKAIAEREWSQGAQHPGEGGAELALRTPQLRAAEASAEAARAAWVQATTNVERTQIRAPFDGFVNDESVSVGQLVTPQSRLGTLVGTGEHRILASIPMASLRALEASESPTVKVEYQAEGEKVHREGRLLQISGGINPQTRMGQVLVSVPKQGADPKHPRLYVGDYVALRFGGPRYDKAFELPVLAIRDGDTVYVDEDGVLAIRQITIIGRDSDTVRVVGDLHDGDRVVVSRLPNALAGMKIRTSTASAPTAPLEPAPVAAVPTEDGATALEDDSGE